MKDSLKYANASCFMRQTRRDKGERLRTRDQKKRTKQSYSKNRIEWIRKSWNERLKTTMIGVHDNNGTHLTSHISQPLRNAIQWHKRKVFLLDYRIWNEKKNVSMMHRRTRDHVEYRYDGPHSHSHFITLSPDLQIFSNFSFSMAGACYAKFCFVFKI